MSTPSDTRFDRRDALGKSAYKSFRDQTDIGQDTKWKDLPNGIKTEWRNVGEAVANTAKHFPEPALSAGSREAQLLASNAKLKRELATTTEAAKQAVMERDYYQARAKELETLLVNTIQSKPSFPC